MPNYTPEIKYEQLDLFSSAAFTQQFLLIPSSLEGFRNTDTDLHVSYSKREVYRMQGTLSVPETERVCPVCGAYLHINNHHATQLRHLPFGHALTVLSFTCAQLLCPACGHSHMQSIPFKAEHHRLTKELENYVCDLLAANRYTNKDIGQLAGIGPNTVKDIDVKRLRELYTEDGKLIRPEQTTEYIGIDEFKLHKGYKFATHIIDMLTGHILWIAEGKKKKVVYDFIEHVGKEWMSHVKAVALDMNSDFAEAFLEKCPHIRLVFDYFHIVKNFNERVIANVRKEEQARLAKEGDAEGAQSLKRSRYVLTSSRKTLQEKDRKAEEGKLLRKGSELFQTPDVLRRPGNLARYEALIKENKLLFTADLVKEKLHDAYSSVDETTMRQSIQEIVDLCKATENEHFKKFASMLEAHFDGIVAHATYKISSGKIEGINNKIKTLRRQAYGYPDDEYFFLKLFDLSRKPYEKNLSSHKIYE